MKMIGGLFGLFVSMFCATSLFWLGIAYEHRPAGWPSWTVHVGPFAHTFRLPDSLAAKNKILLVAEAKAAARASAIERTSGQITVQAQAQEARAQTKIQLIHDVQIKEIPTYVTAQTDHDFAIPWGLVRVHDAAAIGVDVSGISLPAGQSDGAASVITPSQFGSLIVDNYGACHADAQQLSDLQAFIRAQSAAFKTSP
jgi:hypothetical protein